MPHSSHSCPFRVHHSSETLTFSSFSWCAHHNFSDNKSCNSLQPCTLIAAIAEDPSFCIQTALLWIRSGDCTQTRLRAKPISSSVPADVPSIQLNDAIDGKPLSDRKILIREDEPDLGLLHLHRDRLAAAAEALGWRTLACLEHCEQAITSLRAEIEKHMRSRPPPPADSLEAYKVRIFVDRLGTIKIDSALVAVDTSQHPSSLLTVPFVPDSFDQPWKLDTPPCKVYLDRAPTRPSTLTTHKTTDRCVYTSARERLHMLPTTPPTSMEVLLYNPYGEVMETSFCTVYIKRDGTWITPAAICGPNLGVSRRLAIEKGLCKKGTLELRELKVYEEIWLSNAVRGFFKGVLMTDAKRLSECADSKEVLCAKISAGVIPEVGSAKE